MSRMLEINTPLGEDNAVLMSVSGREELGRLPVYRLSLVAKRSDVKSSELLGKNITFGIELPDRHGFRYINGYVVQFSDAGATSASYFKKGNTGRAYLYEITVHSWLWFLTRNSNSRIFQKMSVPEIVEKVCGAYAFAHFDRSRLTENYRKWEYCSQYRETDFNFVSRLLEQEGIYYYFEQEDGKHTLILCDGPGAHKPKDGFAEIPFVAVTGKELSDKEHIDDWHLTHEIQPGRYTINDFNFETPKVDLISKAAKPGDHDLNNYEFYDYPGEYEKPEEGKRYANVRMEELHSQFEVVSARAKVRGIQPGCTFKLTEHSRSAMNKEYLVISASYSIRNNELGSATGGGASFDCSFNAIDAKTTFRPQRITPKPIVQGPQTALVVGPAGEEIYTDKYGRVKLQFPWDRYSPGDENSSCWVRVSQPWAGKGWGGITIPRIGQEVIVEFLEGDPDSPIVTGRTYNADAMPPWELPANKTRAGFKTRTYKGGTSNFNELRFEDKQGAEEIYQHAERDHVLRTKHDRVEWIGNESHLIVTKDVFEKFESEHHLTIKGDENVKLEDGSFSLDVAQDWQGKMGQKMAVDAGTEIHLKSGAAFVAQSGASLTVRADKKVLIAGDDSVSIKGKSAIKAQSDQAITIKGGMKVVIEAGAQLTLKVGGNFITIDPSGVAIKGTMVQINSGGSAASGDAADGPESGAGSFPAAPEKPNEAAQSKGGDNQDVKRPAKPDVYSPQAQALKLAHESGTPFCEVCARLAAEKAAAAAGA